MDSILFWNEVALEANRISHTKKPAEQAGPTLSARALAIVHLAMYDAFQAIVPSAEGPYQAGLPTPPAGSTPQGAVGGAAVTTLTSLFPSQTKFFADKLAEFGGSARPGFAFGVEVANRLLASRKTDPDANGAGYFPNDAPGHHRPDPDNPGQGFYGPFYGARSRLFAITQRFTLDAPPLFNNGEYDPEYVKAQRQVRAQGIAPELMGTVPDLSKRRTPDQTVIGLYWGYDGAIGLGTPPRLYNQIVRVLAAKNSPGKPGTPNTEAQNARLFALVNAAMADAGILAWDEKYKHDLWRPVVGIREHDTSLGPQALEADNDLSDDTDTGWLPLGAPATNALNPDFVNPAPAVAKNVTPHFPAYPSGHATFGAASLHVTRRFYGVKKVDRFKGDDLFKGLDFVSDELNGKNQDNRGAVRPRHRRRFDKAEGGLWRMVLENGASRVYLGVHWIFDAYALGADGNPDFSRNIGGVPLGVNIAENLTENGLKQAKAAGPRIV